MDRMDWLRDAVQTIMAEPVKNLIPCQLLDDLPDDGAFALDLRGKLGRNEAEYRIASDGHGGTSMEGTLRLGHSPPGQAAGDAGTPRAGAAALGQACYLSACPRPWWLWSESTFPARDFCSLVADFDPSAFPARLTFGL